MGNRKFFANSKIIFLKNLPLGRFFSVGRYLEDVVCGAPAARLYKNRSAPAKVYIPTTDTEKHLAVALSFHRVPEASKLEISLKNLPNRSLEDFAVEASKN